MKIARLTRWNATCGVSVHAELVGRQWRKNLDLTVFGPSLESVSGDYHHRTTMEDGEFVIRGYEQPKNIGEDGWVDDRLWKEDYDVLVVESVELMPIPKLLEIFPKIRAKKVAIVHEGKLPEYEGFYKLNFDCIACFDDRYEKMLRKRYPEEKIHIIPFPCNPVVRGDKIKARAKLGMPEDKIILFSFGRQPRIEYDDYLWLVKELSKRHSVEYLAVRSNGGHLEETDLLEIRLERLTTERSYDYLHASDIHMVPKGDTDKIVVSSTIFQCLGSGCPIVIPDVKYVERLNKEVVKYKGRDDLKEKVSKLIEDENFGKETLEAAESYANRNSAEKIAQRLIKVFEDL